MSQEDSLFETLDEQRATVSGVARLLGISHPATEERYSAWREANYLRSLVRMDLRKWLRNGVKARTKFGAEFDEAKYEGRLAFIRETYRRLGGDPDSITGGE